MADVKRFLSWLHSEYLEQPDCFTTQASQEFIAESSIDGWASAGLMKILNYAIGSCMSFEESYLEIGTYAGRSLISGLKNNRATAHVIDNFWDNRLLKPAFEKNLQRFGVVDRVTLHDGDAEELSLTLPPIGVFFYDANHDRGYTHFNLQRFESFLSDEAIVIVDDVKIEAGLGHRCKVGYDMLSQYPVWDDVQQWCYENQYTVTPLCMTPWTFGQALMLYRR